MTLLGKILTFVNLAFSLVVGAFIVLFFAKQTNWHDAADKWQKYADVAEADRKAADLEAEKAVKDKAKAVADVQAELNKAIAARDDLEKKVKAAEAELATAKAEASQAGNTTAAYLAEVNRRRDEVSTYKKLLDARETQVVDLQKRYDKANAEKLDAQIAFKSEQERARNLLDENAKLVADREQTKTRGGATTGGGAGRIETVAKPPPEDVEGMVEESDPRSGLVTISIGSDSGVNKGNTLEVYRFKPRPDYVGMIRIVDSRPHQAVGRAILPLRSGPIQKGDRVAAEILGRR